MTRFNVGEEITTTKSATHPQLEHGRTYLRVHTTTVPSTAMVQYNVGEEMTTTKSATHPQPEHGRMFHQEAVITAP